jgi:adenosine deaminase
VKGFELMQTKEQLRLVTLDLFEQLKADNVIYAEIRFAPLLHLAKGLTPVEVVETVNAAFTEGKAMTGMEGGLILCTLRHYTEAQSMETVHLVQQFKGTNVLAFDMAGDEAGYPVTAHVKAFQFAREQGIHCTCHGGEAKGPESVWETLEHFHPTRIGHGVRSAEDKQLLDHLVKKDIHLEVCPTSNIQTNIFPAIEEHAADKIYRHGVSMSINTDARTVTPVTLSGEYNKLQDTFHWTREHFLRCNLEGIRHSFTTEVVKQKIAARIQEAYNKR